MGYGVCRCGILIFSYLLFLHFIIIENIILRFSTHLIKAMIMHQIVQGTLVLLAHMAHTSALRSAGLFSSQLQWILHTSCCQFFSTHIFPSNFFLILFLSHKLWSKLAVLRQSSGPINQGFHKTVQFHADGTWRRKLLNHYSFNMNF